MVHTSGTAHRGVARLLSHRVRAVTADLAVPERTVNNCTERPRLTASRHHLFSPWHNVAREVLFPGHVDHRGADRVRLDGRLARHLGDVVHPGGSRAASAAARHPWSASGRPVWPWP